MMNSSRVPAIGVRGVLLGLLAMAGIHASWAGDGAPPTALSLTVPVQGGYDFHEVAPNSEAQRLRAAPVPDPSTVPSTHESLHDPNTGADTSAFGTAYSYANPLNDTTSGHNSVGDAASRSAGTPQKTGFSLVLLEWGFPRQPMPKVPGDDLTEAPPPVAHLQFAVQADDEPVLDAKARWIVQRAIEAYGRADLTEITIERPSDKPACCKDFALLVKAELVSEGLGPDRMLPGHRIRLLLASMPVQR